MLLSRSSPSRAKNRRTSGRGAARGTITFVKRRGDCGQRISSNGLGSALDGGNIVTFHLGHRQSAVVHARQNMLDRITTHVVAGGVVIADARSRQGIKGRMSVSVGVPSLTSVSIAEGGAGDVELGDLVASDGHAVLSGSGRIVIDAVSTRP